MYTYTYVLTSYLLRLCVLTYACLCTSVPCLSVVVRIHMCVYVYVCVY